MKLVVYGIPTCGTVKKARAWLDAAGIPYTFSDLRAEPPAASRVAAWGQALGARALRNLSGASWRTLGPEKDGWDDATLLTALAADPMRIKRPVIERDGVAVLVGFNHSDEALRAALVG